MALTDSKTISTAASTMTLTVGSRKDFGASSSAPQCLDRPRVCLNHAQLASDVAATAVRLAADARGPDAHVITGVVIVKVGGVAAKDTTAAAILRSFTVAKVALERDATMRAGTAVVIRVEAATTGDITADIAKAEVTRVAPNVAAD